MQTGRGLIKSLVVGCLGVLLAAFALHAAVQLVVSVWRPLLLIVGCLAAVAAFVTLLRARRRGW